LKTTITDAVKQLVYQNGVFPVQGVRPVFSSIVDVVEANLSSVIFEALVESAEKLLWIIILLKKNSLLLGAKPPKSVFLT
jgi:cell division protease FtsH